MEPLRASLRALTPQCGVLVVDDGNRDDTAAAIYLALSRRPARRRRFGRVITEVVQRPIYLLREEADSGLIQAPGA